LKTVISKKPLPEPFSDGHITMHSIGTAAMTLLIGMSVAGGVCGGGVKIPVMLIFFDMTMH
jgi:hypothetical protein